MWNKVAALTFMVVAMPALAQAMPQTQDEWLVDSGRYIAGQVPSYDQVASYHQVRYAGRLIEGRNSATVGKRRSADPEGSFSSDREQMVSATGS